MKAMIKESLFLLLTALVLTLTAWVFAPPIKAQPKPAGPGVEEIDIETLKLIMNDNALLLLDARPPESFQPGHLPGAINLPAYDFESGFAAMRERFTDQLTVVVYCSSPTCHDADILAEGLQKQGIKNLFLYRGGFDDWTKKGNPVVSGERP